MNGKAVNNDTALNGICPYFTMFPIEFPLSILRDQASEGQWVLDPFCGRGTTNYAARQLGLPTIGIDSSPVAAAIAGAKLANTSPDRIIRSARRILDEVADPSDIPEGDFWDRAYDKSVLRHLCRLRTGLLQNCTSESRKALRGIVLGALHGPIGKTKQSYLSNQCPRTYAPKPAYAVKYWDANGLKEPPRVDVLNVITDRANRYYASEDNRAVGLITCADSRNARTYSRIPTGISVHWVITSPPYYGMRTYLPDQWLRMWFVGGQPSVNYSQTKQIAHSSPDTFVSELKSVWKNLATKCSSSARMVVRFGSINDRKADPLELIGSSLADTGWSVAEIRDAGSACDGKRQSKTFSQSSKDALTEYDIWAVFSGAAEESQI